MPISHCFHVYLYLQSNRVIWDEREREANLAKHKLDFTDTFLVYEDPKKFTRGSLRKEEARNADIAVVEIMGACLTPIYIERGEDIRIISFRNPSRKERGLYAESRQRE